MSENNFVAKIGLDWADKKHDFCLLENGRSKCEYGTFLHTPATIEEWVLNLYLWFNGQSVAICLELKSGPIVSCLQKFGFITLFFVPLKELAKYRDIFCQSGAKDDPTDAYLQLNYLMTHPETLREVTVDDENTRIIQRLTEHRKFFVEEQVAQSERIRAGLKAYYPLVLELFNDLNTIVFCDFLKRWPNLTELKKARECTLVEFLKSHNSGQRGLLERRLNLIKEAVALTEDVAIIIPAQLYTLSLIKQLKVLLETIKEYDKEIECWFNKHKDKELFESLPGAGKVLAPRLLAAFGADRSRFANANELIDYAGISPVTFRSGEKYWIHWRFKCSTFIRQTFVEWAYQTTKASYWSKAFYDKNRSQGKSHQATLRLLAFKWIRIIFRCWKNNTKYDEATYMFALNRRHSEIEN
ncbi:MAG: transposase [Gammaproteobacteria bacterium]|nr:transposase [Gammaproteobacteria bacterium]